MLRFSASVAAIACLVAGAMADPQAEADLVRLPGQGELRAPAAISGEPRQRLVPGGGLFLSFDRDGDGVITQGEVRIGIVDAFAAADANGNGALAALEQQAWAASLPTRDESLANPVRFDPNLDRNVSPEEFAQVILGLAEGYGDPQTGDIHLEDLKAPESAPERIRSEPPELAARNGF